MSGYKRMIPLRMPRSVIWGSALGAISLVWLASCMSSSPPPGDSVHGQLLGDYLVGTYANLIDDADNRAVYYAKAYNLDSGNVQLGRRAVTSAITAGDMDMSYDLAAKILAEDLDEPMARAILGVKAFAQGAEQEAIDYFKDDTPDMTVEILMDLVRGWAEAEIGEVKQAERIFDNLSGGPYFSALGELMKAKLAAYEKDYDKALKILDGKELSQYEAAMGAVAPIEGALTKARILSNAGRLNDAKDHMDEFNAANDGFETGPVAHYVQILDAGKSLDIFLTPKQEAARALTEVSYGFFVRNRALDAADVYLRMALTLDPSYDKARLWLGSILENTNRSDEALELYRSIPESSPFSVSAKLYEANIFFDRDEDDKAMAILERTNRDHESFITRESLGRARLIRENYADALPIYIELVDSMSEEELTQNPQPLYFRGICYERESQWDKAEADFKRVLNIDPDDADALNYLGYTWVDRGENLTEAFDMINKAVELEPESGAIIDSLGWAHYKLGEYDDARLNLEKATELTPYSATIIDHLGDVYWKLGRFREAGYQWRRALEFDPTDKEQAAINKKLQGGLEAALEIP